MSPDFYNTDEANPLWRWGVIALSLAAFTVYLMAAAFSAVVFPAAIVLFLAPLFVLILAAVPQGRAAPKKLVMLLLYAGAALLPLWPVYIHLKLGPMPIITPPRLILYALTAIWLADMLSSPLRRAQFIVGLKRGGAVSFFIILLFVISALSIPMAEGRVMAVQEFFRQSIIWLLPFFVAVTYMRRQRDLNRLIVILTVGAVINAAIAVLEKASGHLLAQVLSPFITGSGEWLQIVQAQKIRDGVFRAQGTHTHPLSLGEYVAFAAPFATIFMIRAKQLAPKLLWGAAVLILIAGAAATSSRGAALAIAVSFIATAAILLQRSFRDGISARYAPVVAFFVLCTVVMAPAGFIAAEKVISGDSGTSATNSSQARLDQIEMAWPKILKRPVGGYGTGRATRILGYWGRSLTLDNYYLTLALDFGFPGPIIFAGLMGAVALTSYRRSREGPPGDQLIYVGFLAAIIAFATTRTIVSMTGNLSFMYILLGAFVGAGAYLKPRPVRSRLRSL